MFKHGVFKDWIRMIRDWLHCVAFLATCLAISVEAGTYVAFIGFSTAILRDKLQEGCYTVQ